MLARGGGRRGGGRGREEGIFESPGSAGLGDTVYRWIGLNWATGKGAESRDGAWGSSTHTALYPQRGQLGRPERSSSERTGCLSSHRCPG